MKPLVIYHGNCQDGFTAAWACWKKNPGWEYYPDKHGELPPEVLWRDVYMLDFSYKRPVIEEMMGKVNSLTILDHHKTAEADLQFPFACDPAGVVDLEIIFDMNKSGARLAWEYFHPGEEAPELVKYVEDRDLWRFLNPNTKAVSAWLFASEYTFGEWNAADSIIQTNLEQAVSTGLWMLQKQAKDTTELLQNKFKVVIGGVEVWTCNLPYTFSSDAGNLLAQDAPFGSTFYLDGDSAHFSLRSTESGLDVSEIAKQYGGGGHKHAAGFKTSIPFRGKVI